MTEEVYQSNIIDKAAHVPFLVRLRDVILTIVLWVMYFYFMRGFFALVGDMISWAFNGFTNTERYDSLRVASTFMSYIEIIDILGLLFIVWSLYNLLWFGSKKRRRATLPVTSEQTADMYHVDLADLRKWQKATSLVMHHDQNGRLLKVDTE